MGDHRTPRKPTWLKQETYVEMLDRCSGVPRCEKCCEQDDLTVDHIVPRWAGGTNDLSNLQFLCARENFSKGIKPDTHWAQSFYWDKTPNLDAFRGAQRLLFEEITGRPDWFGRPTGEIAGRLYVNAWVVAAGKTLGIAAAAWAVNHVLRERWGACPRAGCLLVVAKERAVRDQIADDLATDIVKYGILPQAPRVGVVEHGWQFGQEEWLDQHDVIVTCVQQLWEREDGKPRTDPARILAHFPVIAFDEPHFAADQVSRLVEAASASICFGFTGTPIDSAGRLLKQMVALTVYGYDQATYIDRSLKWLDSDPGLYREFVREIGITEARLIEHGQRTTTDNAEKDGYGKNIEPAKTVVRAVIDEMKRRDQLVVAAESVAPHRDPASVKIAEPYPSHGMVVCGSVNEAITLCENTNSMFERDFATYPPSEGWQGTVVYTDTEDAEGKRIPGKPLTTDHPWLRAKHQGYRLDAKCARLIFVVGIGREGVNNPACGPVGIATPQGSLIEVVQRALGRQLRAVVSCRRGQMLVPPAPLDTVLIITHLAFRNADLIRRAINFICEMEEQLARLHRIDDLGDEGVEVTKIEHDVALSTMERIAVVGRLGEADKTGETLAIDDVVTEFAGLDAGPRADLIREWALTVRSYPDAAREKVHLGRGIKPNLIVTREQIKQDPTDSDLERHLKIHLPALVGKYVPITEAYRELITALYAEHASHFHLPPLTSDDHIEDIRRRMTSRVLRHVGRYYTGERKHAHKLVAGAVKLKLCVPDGESARNDSDWDIPQVHALLRRPDVQAEIVGWVTTRLIDEGLCPALDILRGPEVLGA